MEYIPAHAPFMVLGFLSTGCLLLLIGALSLLALLYRKYVLFGGIFAGGVLVVGIYFGILLSVSLASQRSADLRC